MEIVYYYIGCGNGKNESSEKKFCRWKSFILDFETFEKAFLCHERWGGGVMSATFCITRGDESAQRAPSDAKIGTSDTTPSPRVPQKALFKGREGQKGTDFQPKNSLPQPRTFHVVLTNMIGCFFILVKGFCNRFFFYLIPYGSLKICNQRLKTTFQHQVVLFQH